MSEREHSFENRESQEQQLARLLKERGIEDPETKKLVMIWNDEQEKIIVQSTGAEYSKAQINFELKKGRLWLAAGDKEESFDRFNDALYRTEQEGLDELRKAIEEEMDKIWPKQI